jgi:NaMN:DMB phosphoribosyltransferase
MSIDVLNKYLSNIKSLDIEAMAKARTRLDNLAKPPGSLGKLEDIAVTLAGIKGLNPSVPHSLSHVRASTDATSLRSSIRGGFFLT